MDLCYKGKIGKVGGWKKIEVKMEIRCKGRIGCGERKKRTLA